MKDQSAADWSIVRPAAPPNVRSGIGSTVRSGLNLPAASASASLRPLHALVHRGDRLGRRAGERLLGGQLVVGVDDGDDGGRARLELLAQAGLEAAVDLVLGEPADDAAGRGADGDGASSGGAARPTSDADAAAPARALAAQVVAGVGDVDLAGLVAADQDHAVGPDLLLLDELAQLVEVLLGRLERRVGGQDQVVGVAHNASLCLLANHTRHAGLRRGGRHGRPTNQSRRRLLPRQHRHGLALQIEVRLAAHVDRDPLDRAAGERYGDPPG